MPNQLFKSIFKKYSKTYYYSSLWFPKSIREDVFVLYSFVRLPDEYVDNPVEDPVKQLKYYRQTFESAWKGKVVNHPVIEEFVIMAKRRDFQKKWIDEFLTAMEMDLTVNRYRRFEDLLKYTYGSAEVIGLMMAKIMGVKTKGSEAAQKLGLAMQLINFVRDIGEDWERGRIYIPIEDLEKFKISSEEWGKTIDPEKFNKLVRFEIDRIWDILDQSESDFEQIPLGSRRAVQMATNLYRWASREIYNQPMIVWSRQVKPTIWQIGEMASKNLIPW